MASMDPEIAKTQEERKKMEQQLASLTSVAFDTDLYGGNKPFEGYEQSIPVNDEEENFDAMDSEVARKLASYTAPKSILKDMPRVVDEDESMGFKQPSRIINREDEYRRRRLNQKEDTLRLIAKKKKEEERKASGGGEEKEREPAANAASQQTQKRGNSWDQSQDENNVKKVKTSQFDWDMTNSTPGIGRWDETPTPGRVGDVTPSLLRRNRWDETPTPGRLAHSDATPAGGGVTPGATPAGMTWDATPKLAGLATPTPKRQWSRWDETPATMGSATPMAGATPGAAYTPGVTLVGGVELATPTPGAINLRGAITPEHYNLLRWEKDIEERNHPLTDEELDSMFPQEGYKILEPPPSYVPIRTPARKLLATPTPLGTPLYLIPEENGGQQFDVPKELPGGLPFMKPEDYQYFGVLLNEEEEEELTAEEQKERKIMKLLLKVKNGTPPQRETALRQLTD
ncbi:Splicing factor 3B subunit 1 [Camellia lanceoleosa]|uniref:Splicing factor 3B subunit 1 n=1 Tax=Camellia lanceoleosa TaxID=1840588 RepID=A0ACC0FP33_9ERIC|nr:Splicing factor 3B subunit 1 [Camellia lanceoleosa]